MPANTPKLALPYPIAGDTVDVPRDVQALATALDNTASSFTSGTIAARPAAGVGGRLYYATDTLLVYLDTGTAWIALNISSACALLADQVLAVNGPSFDFTGIAQTYKHLRLIISSRDVNANPNEFHDVALRFNGIATASYSNHVLEVTTVTSVFLNTAQTWLVAGTCMGGGAAAGIFAQSVIDISDYAATTHTKNLTAQAGGRLGPASPAFQRLINGQFHSNAAIDRITIYNAIADFAAGSRATLYGFN